MSNAAFNVAFGAFLSAGLDYATCAKKAQELVDALAPKGAASADVATLTVAREDERQREDESQTDFVIRACKGGERSRAWFVGRIRTTSADPAHVASVCLSQLIRSGIVESQGRRGHRTYRAVQP